jgi:hypothetical protein
MKEKVKKILIDLVGQASGLVVLVSGVADHIDSLYTERDEQTRQALEWACQYLCKNTDEWTCVKNACPIKQAKEGK